MSECVRMASCALNPNPCGYRVFSVPDTCPPPFTSLHPPPCCCAESHVIVVVRTVLMTPVTDFIEDAVALVVSCTHTTVTETMWQAFDLIYEVIASCGRGAI